MKVLVKGTHAPGGWWLDRVYTVMGATWRVGLVLHDPRGDILHLSRIKDGEVWGRRRGAILVHSGSAAPVAQEN